jgi:hypothetical protein
MPTNEKKLAGNPDLGFGHNPDIMPFMEDVPSMVRGVPLDGESMESDYVPQSRNLSGQQDTFLGYPLFDWGTSGKSVCEDGDLLAGGIPESPHIVQ